ncbi:hypothetical protein ACFTAO_26860 [Paenibacillus rhizoplanae]
MAIAALQSRLKQEAGTATPKPSANLNQEKLGQTFTSMPAADAAVLLGSMYSLSPDKVITILNTVSDSVRSSILGGDDEERQQADCQDCKPPDGRKVTFEGR